MWEDNEVQGDQPTGGCWENMPKVLVTGSCGLIGSEVARFFARQGFQIHGIDDNHRAVFFGPEGDTSWVLERLRRKFPATATPC
jgi:nucleoside-diphosphate-sugar epimerase